MKHSQLILQKKISLNNNSLVFLDAFSADSKISFSTFPKKKKEYDMSQDETVQPSENYKAVFPSVIPGNFVTCNYGFFCRQELKIEKATNIPIRFRLGSLEQCNYYEGKH